MQRGSRLISIRRLIELVVVGLGLTAVLTIIISTTLNQRTATAFDHYFEESLPALDTLKNMELEARHVEDVLSTLHLLDSIPLLTNASQDMAQSIETISALEKELEARIQTADVQDMLSQREALLQALQSDFEREQQMLQQQMELRVRLRSTETTILSLVDSLLLAIDLSITESRAQANNHALTIDGLVSMDAALRRVPLLLAEALASDTYQKVAANQREIDLVFRDLTADIQNLSDDALLSSLSGILRRLYRESQPNGGFFPTKTAYLRLQEDLRRRADSILRKLEEYGETSRAISTQIREQESGVLQNLSGNVRLGVTVAMVLTALVLLIAGFVYFHIMPRYLLRPLRQAANSIASMSDPDAPYRPMQSRIQELAQIEDALELFHRYRSALSEREQALQSANQALNESDKKQRLFIRVASHDLKSPLRGIAQLAEAAHEDLTENATEEALRSVERIEARAQNMTRLLDDLLEYLSLEHLETRPETLPLLTTVNEHIDILDKPPGIQLRVDGPDTDVCLHWPPFLTVLRNLVDNAIKHHDRETGRIHLTLHFERTKLLHLEIEDDGPGIAPEFHERVFQAFETLRPKEQTLSSGLGLAVILRFVESEGGSVSLESPIHQGRGCRFSVSWPLVESGSQTGQYSGTTVHPLPRVARGKAI